MAVNTNPYVGIQVIVAADFSSSMNDPISVDNRTRRIDALKSKIHWLFNEVCKYDPDGIDVITFSNKIKLHRGVKTMQAVNDIFKKGASGSTDTTGMVLQAFELHKEYRQKSNFKATVILAFTDGEPNDAVSLSTTLCQISNLVSSGIEIGYSFIQVGTNERAAMFLKSLDNLDVKNDIVDTKNFDDLGTTLTIEDIFNKALNG